MQLLAMNKRYWSDSQSQDLSADVAFHRTGSKLHSTSVKCPRTTVTWDPFGGNCFLTIPFIPVQFNGNIYVASLLPPGWPCFSGCFFYFSSVIFSLSLLAQGKKSTSTFLTAYIERMFRVWMQPIDLLLHQFLKWSVDIHNMLTCNFWIIRC